ncbi:hypothetical protein [Actinopolymorpha alba]|nr:hypothetical protein [Actinopolymorpha alba]
MDARAGKEIGVPFDGLKPLTEERLRDRRRRWGTDERVRST